MIYIKSILHTNNPIGSRLSERGFVDLWAVNNLRIVALLHKKLWKMEKKDNKLTCPHMHTLAGGPKWQDVH